VNGYKKFWDKQARKHKGSVIAVNFDPLMEELEYFSLEQFINPKETICDIGCGNGLTLLRLAQKYGDSVFYGIDFSEEMIKIARSKKKTLRLKNINFYVGNIIDGDTVDMFDFSFDKIITKRLLINLRGKNKQKAICNISRMLKKDGSYLMVECFIEPLKRINEIRKKLELQKIRVKKFNEYLALKPLKRITKEYFMVEKEIDFGSLYYFTSRIYNAYLSKGKPDYFADINKIAVEVTKHKKHRDIISGYSPEKMLVLSKHNA